MRDSEGVDYSRPPPTTIWDLLQLMLVVGLFSALARPMLDEQVGALAAFSAILAGDLAVFIFILYVLHWTARRAQSQAGRSIASLPHTREHLRTRRLAYYITLLASLPYQAVLLTFAANFRELGLVVVAVVLAIHLAVAIATLLYWRRSRWRGALFCDNGVLLHGSHFFPWEALDTFRTSEAGNRLVIYEPGRMRFRHHEFVFSPQGHPALLPLLEKRLRKSL